MVTTERQEQRGFLRDIARAHLRPVPVTFRKPLESEDLGELNLTACFTLVSPVPRTLSDA